MWVYNKHLRKGVFVSAFCDLNPTGQLPGVIKFFILWNNDLRFKIREVGLGTFHLILLSILNTMKQNKGEIV